MFYTSALSFFLLVAAVGKSHQSEPFLDTCPSVSTWDKLKISRDRLGYVEYGDFGVDIYQHADNHKFTTTPNLQKYFYAPIALLDHESAVSVFNNVKKQPEMRFRVEMWNTDVRNEVVNWLTQTLNRQIQPNQVEVIPLDTVVLDSSSSSPLFSLPDSKPIYNNNKYIYLTISCIAQLDCDQLADTMRSDPEQFNHFKLSFSFSLKMAQTKEINIHIESVTSGQMYGKLLQKFGPDQDIFLTADDEKKMLTEMATNIRMDTSDDSIIVSPSSAEKEIYKLLKSLLISSRTSIKEQSDKMWDSVFWNDDNYRPDKTARTLNEQYEKIKEKNKQHAHNSSTDTNKFSIFGDYGLFQKFFKGSIDLDFSRQGPHSEEDLRKFFDETKDHVEWDGEKFVPKPMQLSRINLSKIRDAQFLQDKKVRVIYTTAVLSTPINIFHQKKLTAFSEWQQIKSTVDDLKNKVYERTNSEMVDIGKMPSSCEDLQRMGNKISGIFLVKGSTKYEAVYCDFHPNHNDGDLQKWIGYVDIKSLPVHFYVTRYDSFGIKSTPIPFQRVIVNSGNAMDLATGVFKARRMGTYFFSFTGLANFPTSSSLVYLGVKLYLNGGEISAGRIEEANTVAGQKGQLTLQSTLNLKKGDKVWLQINCISPGVSLYDEGAARFTHFTGILLEEEFVTENITYL